MNKYVQLGYVSRDTFHIIEEKVGGGGEKYLSKRSLIKHSFS